MRRSDRRVEAWAGYQLQFGGMRRHAWQDQLMAAIKSELAALEIGADEPLAAVYQSTDPARCDVENRLFTNPGPTMFPKHLTAIRWERGPGQPPAPPVSIELIAGQLHYYCYRAGGTPAWWQRAETLARWTRVPRLAPADGSARPAWYALRQALADGHVDLPTRYTAATPFGLSLTVHGTTQGPRSAPAISETLVDGVLAAFHTAAEHGADDIAAILAARIQHATTADLLPLIGDTTVPALFTPTAFLLTQGRLQISPCDHLCDAGEVTIKTADTSGRHVEISGELFTLQPASP